MYFAGKLVYLFALASNQLASKLHEFDFYLSAVCFSGWGQGHDIVHMSNMNAVLSIFEKNGLS